MLYKEIEERASEYLAMPEEARTLAGLAVAVGMDRRELTAAMGGKGRKGRFLRRAASVIEKEITENALGGDTMRRWPLFCSRRISAGTTSAARLRLPA